MATAVHSFAKLHLTQGFNPHYKQSPLLIIKIYLQSQCYRITICHIRIRIKALRLSCQSLREHSMQTPLKTQWWSGMSVGMRMNMRKLLLCPVVARTPLRSAVRYTGQS